MAHFTKVFQRKAKLDISSDKRAMQRLRRACENVKRTLSTQTSGTVTSLRLEKTRTTALMDLPTAPARRSLRYESSSAVCSCAGGARGAQGRCGPAREHLTRIHAGAPTQHEHQRAERRPAHARACCSADSLSEPRCGQARFEELCMDLFKKTMAPVEQVSSRPQYPKPTYGTATHGPLTLGQTWSLEDDGDRGRACGASRCCATPRPPSPT